MNEPLDDTSPMPFGKHKNRPMQDVPATYLHFLWHLGGLRNETKTNNVAAYIAKSLSALRQETPDLLW